MLCLIKEIWKYGNPLFFLLLSEVMDYCIGTQLYIDVVSAIFDLEDASVVIASRSIVELISRFITLMPICIAAMRNASYKMQHEKCQAAFFRYIRKSAVASMKAAGVCLKQISEDDINIRVFTKRRNRLVFHDLKGCYSHEIDGGLAFSLDNDEGLVAEAYKTKKACCEMQNGADEKYNLTERNKAKVKDLKFIVAIPIFGEKEEIKCIVCFDSIKQVCTKAENVDKIVTEHLFVPAYDFYENLVE